MNNCFVYHHVRIDKNQVFYIGIGTYSKKGNKYSRAYSINRNNLWKSIAAKTPYTVEIIIDGISWQEACIKESEFIIKHGRIIDGNGTLSNFTMGGDGIPGYKHSEETIVKMKKSAIGRIISPEQKEKARINSTGNKNTVGYKHSDDFKQKCKVAQTGKKMSEDAKKKIGNFWRGKSRPDSVKKKISDKLKGRVVSIETRDKIRQTLLKRNA